MLRLLVRATTLAVAAALAVPLTGPAPAQAVEGVPDGAPAAAHRPEPRLEAPRGWPFAQRISRTSGTGRLHGGASYWTDFVYDDHGAAVPSGMTLENTAKLAPEQGVYTYPLGPANGNGADIFVAAVGADDRATYWRVDWNTLVDPDVPIAVWTFDTDDDKATGTDQWPAGAGVTSPGMERALVVSSRSARVVDLATGKATDVTARGGRLTVDKATRSFVVRVPRALLPATGAWRVRLAAGLASADGTTMAPPSLVGGLPSLGGLPHVYNLGFRTVSQEEVIHRDGQSDAIIREVGLLLGELPGLGTLGADGLARFVTGNFWMEDNQADSLATGNVSEFSRLVTWDELRDRARTPEPLVLGWSNRWYVSDLDLGQGVVPDSQGGSGDGRPNYLGRIQPYGVHVPLGYSHGQRTPLTWVLHSLSVNHNQYGAFDPKLLQDLCNERDSICVTTLGHGPDGWYFNEAESDFWSVWRSMAKAYTLDPRGTVMSGYSMGGYASYKLTLSHPDLYAASIPLAGPPTCGVSLDGDTMGGPAFGGRCASDGSTAPLVGNARWVPFRIGHGTADQLVPFTSAEAQVQRFDTLGLRHLFVRYPGEDHLGFAVQDRFDTVIEGLGRPTVVRNPRLVDYTWRPNLDHQRLGLGATTAYWTSGLQARDTGRGSLARVIAQSWALPGDTPEVVRTGPDPVAEPLPAIRAELAWQPGPAELTKRWLDLRLTNVEAVTVDMRRARVRCGVVAVQTDGPVRVTLRGLRGGTEVLRLPDDKTVPFPC